MSFLRLHKLCSYLLALTGLFAILLPGELHPITWLVVFVASAVSWRFETPRILDPTYRLRWTYLTVFGVLLAALVGLMGILPNPILLGAYLLILLQINKLFNRRENKDYLHLYILSFLMLTLGTILNTGIGFAICFLLYVIFITWALTLFHLRREIEETYLMRHSEELEDGEKVDVSQILQSQRLVRGGFLASISLIALLIFLMSSTLFFLFPRLGFGLFFQRNRQGVRASGFSNEIKLGSFGRIQINRKVILRVELPDFRGKKPKRLRYYWRGLSYDLYDGTSWKRSRRFNRNVRFRLPDRYVIRKLSRDLRKRAVTQVIYQEPLDVPVLFGIDQVYEVRLPISTAEQLRRRVPSVRFDVIGESLSFRRFGAQDSSIKYTVLSVPQDLRPLASQAKRYRKLIHRFYLQLPVGLNPKIKALALEVTRGARTAEEKARRIERYLSQNYRYSLERQAFTGPPLDNFLFVQRLGHCEFFSTAMTVMMRTLGIPARQVTGFYSASWNKYGQFYAVRQSDAHAWSEVMLGDRGWKRFDASPRAAPSSLDSVWRTMEAYVDALRLRWYKWIIEYDLVHQLRALKFLRSKVSWDNPSLSVSPKSKQQIKQTGYWLGGIFLVLVLLGGAWWRRRRVVQGRSLSYSAVSQLYLMAILLLQERGMERAPTETPSEFLARLQRERPALASPMTTLTEVYLQLRYNPHAGTLYRLSQLTEALGELRQKVQAEMSSA